MTDLLNPDDFRRQWEAIDDPKAIREAFEADQAAEDEATRRLEDELRSWPGKNCYMAPWPEPSLLESLGLGGLIG